MSSSRTCGCDSQLINYLQSQAPRHALFVSSSMAQTQDPAIDQVQSQAEHFPHSPAPGPRSCSRSGSYSIRGTAGGGFARSSSQRRVGPFISRHSSAHPGCLHTESPSVQSAVTRHPAQIVLC